MTKEERTAHANDISNKYIHNLLKDDVMEEIKTMPIQDIITLYSNASYAIENEFFKDISVEAIKNGEEKATAFNNARNNLKTIVIERLKTADAIWTVFDQITRAPFIDDVNKVWIFTEKILADECVDYFMQQYRTTFEVVEIKKDELIRFFGITTHMRGAEIFQVDMGAYAGIALKGSEIIPPPDFSDTPEISIPVMNPVLFRSIAKLLEERFYRMNYDGKAEKLRMFEDEMIKTFCTAKFLVPIKGLDNALDVLNEATGEAVIKEKTTIQIPCLTREQEDTEKATPVFTDWEEFNKIYSQEEWRGWIWKAEDLLSAPDDIIVVNAGSFAFNVSKKMLEQMFDIYNKEFKQHPKSGGPEAVSAALEALKKKDTDQ